MSDVRSGRECTSENLHKRNENRGSKLTISELWKLANESQLTEECLF